ncbi:MAG: SipW-dependent-type signal peptide-containing protein [Chryseotalea sp.]
MCLDVFPFANHCKISFSLGLGSGTLALFSDSEVATS